MAVLVYRKSTGFQTGLVESVPLPATTGVLVEMSFLLGFWAKCDVRLLLVLGECKFSGFLKDIPTKSRKISDVFVCFWEKSKPNYF